MITLWKELDGSQGNEVKKESFMNFLKSHRIITDKQQFQDFMKIVLNSDENFNFLNKNQFLQAFCSPVIIIGFKNNLKLSKLQKNKDLGLLTKEDPLICQI